MTMIMPQSAMAYVIATALLCACLFVATSSAQAQTPPCLPGVPCTVPLTANPTPLNPNPAPDPPPDGPNSASAPNQKKTDLNSCDADFMNQIQARAFLEASRETMMNQTAIRKPDSVMEYSCFDQALDNTINIAAPIFSGKQWTPSSVPNPNAAAITLQVFMEGQANRSIGGLVNASLTSYIGSNFSNDFLGGSAAGENNTIGGGAGGCDFMNSVYRLAKCANFELDDQMLTFKELVSLDPRNIFGGSSCTSPITQELIDVAENKDFEHVNFDKKNAFTNLTGAQICAPPIPTGVKVEIKEFRAVGGVVRESSSKIIDDSVCPNPGCYFTGTSCSTNP